MVCCIICLEECNLESCDHCTAHFHKKCIIEMITTSINYNKCPQCRKLLPLCYTSHVNSRLVNKTVYNITIIDLRERRPSICEIITKYFIY